MKKFLFLSLFIFWSLSSTVAQNITVYSDGQNPPTITYESIKPMYPALQESMNKAVHGFENIPFERKKLLGEVADYISEKREAGEIANLIFICTHNSRRSHMSQLWASTAAVFYGIDESISTYSGGTEATAFNPRAVAAMERAGFQIENPGGTNPEYEVRYADEAEHMICFSKKFGHPFNDARPFAAIMVCSDADKNCPVVPGAEERFAIPYVDPKIADDTDREEFAYDTRSQQIASEMAYLMSKVK